MSAAAENTLNLGRILIDLTERRNSTELAHNEASNDLDAFCVAMAYMRNKQSTCENKRVVNVIELPAKARHWVARMEKGTIIYSHSRPSRTTN